jgi:TolA-binding protein
MRLSCVRLWEIDAVREGRLSAKDAEASARHVRVCPACSAVLLRDQRLRELSALLPSTEPGELELRRVRARILRDAANGTERAPAWGWALWGACLAVTLVAVLVVRHHVRVGSTSIGARAPRPSPAFAEASSARFAGLVSPADGARWSQARDEMTERVRLETGSLRIHVRHQNPDERFIVVLPDGELEVRGTTFEVTANVRATERVHVEEGVVALRIGQSDPIVLAAGATWAATASSPNQAAADVRSAPSGSPARRPRTLARGAAAMAGDRAPGAVDDGTDAYNEAVGLMANHRFADAAEAFRDFVAAHPSATQVEDASFLEAIALARTGRTDAAALAAERHIQRFPRSFHRKQAAILIARAARDRGDCDRARSALAPWLAEADGDALAELKTCAARSP